VPIVGRIESIRSYLALVLSSPLQRDVLPEEVAADPGFGSAGSGLDFAQTTVPLSVLRAAIIANEPRLDEVEIESVDGTDPARPGVKRRTGVIVRGRLAASGEPVQLEYRVEELSVPRERRAGGERAGVEESAEEDGHAGRS
jgi:hypothetical protein